MYVGMRYRCCLIFIINIYVSVRDITPILFSMTDLLNEMGQWDYVTFRLFRVR